MANEDLHFKKSFSSWTENVLSFLWLDIEQPTWEFHTLGISWYPSTMGGVQATSGEVRVSMEAYYEKLLRSTLVTARDLSSISAVA